MARAGAPRIARCEQKVCLKVCEPSREARPPSSLPYQLADDLLREGPSAIRAEDPRTSEMPIDLKSIGQARRKRHAPRPTTFGAGYLTLPLGVPNPELPLCQVDVCPGLPNRLVLRGRNRVTLVGDHPMIVIRELQTGRRRYDEPDVLFFECEGGLL
jgi:hypothetical protein